MLPQTSTNIQYVDEVVNTTRDKDNKVCLTNKTPHQPVLLFVLVTEGIQRSSCKCHPKDSHTLCAQWYAIQAFIKDMEELKLTLSFHFPVPCHGVPSRSPETGKWVTPSKECVQSFPFHVWQSSEKSLVEKNENFHETEKLTAFLFYENSLLFTVVTVQLISL